MTDKTSGARTESAPPAPSNVPPDVWPTPHDAALAADRAVVRRHTRHATMRVDRPLTIRVPGSAELAPRLAFIRPAGAVSETRVRYRRGAPHEWVCDACGPQLNPACVHARMLHTLRITHPSERN